MRGVKQLAVPGLAILCLSLSSVRSDEPAAGPPGLPGSQRVVELPKTADPQPFVELYSDSRPATLPANIEPLPSAAFRPAAAESRPAPESAPAAQSRPAPSSQPAPSPFVTSFCRISLIGDPSFRHAGDVTQIVQLSDGQRLLSSGNDGTVRLWDLRTGKELRRFNHSGYYVWDVRAMPDQKRIVTCGEQGAAVLWDLETGRQIRTYEHKKHVFRVAIDRQGKRLASTDTSGAVNVWEIDSGKLLKSFRHKDGKDAYTVAFLGDDELLVGYSDSLLKLWSLSSDKSTTLLQKADTDSIYTAIPSADGKRILICCSNRSPRLLHVESREFLWQADQVKSSTYAASWSPDGSRFAVSIPKEESLCVFSSDGSAIWRRKLPGSTFYSVAYSPDGKEIFCGASRLICRFDASTGNRIFPAQNAPATIAAINGVAPLPGGQMVIEAGAAPGVRLWDRKRNAVACAWLTDKEVHSIGVSPDGKWLLVFTSGNDRGVRILEAATGKENRFLTEDSSYYSVENFLFTPDSSIVVFTTSGSLTCWSLKYGQALFRLDGISTNAGVGISADGMHLAVLSGEGRSTMYRFPDGLKIRELPAAPKDTRGCTFIPGNLHAMVSWTEGKVMLWLSPPSAEQQSASQEEIRRLIRQLGSDDYKRRDEASSKLLAIGEAALPIIRRTETTDEEVVLRLDDIVRKMTVNCPQPEVTDTIDLKIASRTISFHPDGRHWAAVVGDLPGRQVVIGDIADGKLKVLGYIQDPGMSNTAVFDAKGQLWLGNGNGTISVYSSN